MGALDALIAWMQQRNAGLTLILTGLTLIILLGTAIVYYFILIATRRAAAAQNWLIFIRL